MVIRMKRYYMFDRATGKIHTTVSSADEGEALDMLASRCVAPGPWMICKDANRQGKEWHEYLKSWRKAHPVYRADAYGIAM